MVPKSNLDLINECDGFPYFQADPNFYLKHIDTYYHLRVSSDPNITLGFLLPSVALTLSNLPDWEVDSESNPRIVTLTASNDEPSRSTAIAKTTAAMRQTGHFKILNGWRNELYPVYGPEKKCIFTIERSASALFGVVTYGVHMTAYFMQSPAEGSSVSGEEEMKIWVPRRSKTKQTYPFMLDNTVAGGIAAGEEPLECLVRECMEEASLPEALVRRKVKAVGCVTYFAIRDERAGGETGLLQPECQYVYDLDLTGEGVECKPNDEEVAGFELLGVAEVKEVLAKGEFKPNCALVMVDFLIRHGWITKEEEPDYVEIMARLHRKLEFPMA